jgi:hypothetical protein
MICSLSFGASCPRSDQILTSANPHCVTSSRLEGLVHIHAISVPVNIEADPCDPCPINLR